MLLCIVSPPFSAVTPQNSFFSVFELLIEFPRELNKIVCSSTAMHYDRVSSFWWLFKKITFDTFAWKIPTVFDKLTGFFVSQLKAE